MTSKRRAELAANNLLGPVRERREKRAEKHTRWLVKLYPELTRCRPSLRRVTLRDARSLTARNWAVRSVCAVLVVLFFSYFVVLPALDVSIPAWAVYIAYGLIILYFVWRYVQIKRFLATEWADDQ